MLIFFDIDGTLADIRERAAKAGKEPGRENKQEFQAWLDRIQDHATLAADKPIPGMLQLALALDIPGNNLVYLTGRAEKYREVTQNWLNGNGFPIAPLIMRPDSSWQSAAEYKETAIKRVRELYLPQDVLVLDDDGSGDCEAMYKRLGFTFLNVRV